MNPALHTKEEIEERIMCLETKLKPQGGDDGVETAIAIEQQELILTKIEELKTWL